MPNKFFGSLCALALAGCSFTPDRMAPPPDWRAVDDATRTLSVTGHQGWQLFGEQTLGIGDYTATTIDRSFWDAAPSNTGFQIGIGGIHVGGRRLHDDSRFRFRLAAQGADLARIQCRQFLLVEDLQGGAGDRDVGQIILSGNIAYQAELHCRAEGIHPDWPAWQLDLRASDLRPLFGILAVAGETWPVAGSQQALSGPYDRTTGYRISRGEDRSVALVDRLDDGQLRLRTPLTPAENMALIGAAAALLIARDPLAP